MVNQVGCPVSAGAQAVPVPGQKVARLLGLELRRGYQVASLHSWPSFRQTRSCADEDHRPEWREALALMHAISLSTLQIIQRAGSVPAKTHGILSSENLQRSFSRLQASVTLHRGTML